MESSHGQRVALGEELVAFGSGRRLRSSAKVLPEQARAHNRSLVLQTLYHRGAMSRADLARETGLTRVTISDLVAESIADGIIHEIGVREAAGPGKPPIEIDIDREGHQVIGIDLSGASEFTGSVLDLGGRTLVSHSTPLPEERDAEHTYQAVVDLARRLATSATRPVLGVGIGSPGVVRSDGLIINASNLAWQDFPLERRLTEDLGLPVMVGNDANAAILAEYTFGEARSDLMLIRIDRGVGAGVITGGRPLVGARFAAGEIGHVVVGTDGGPLCSCGRIGCLEAWVNVPRLLAETAAAPERRGEILADAGTRLGMAIALIVAALDLAEVVIAGPAELFDGVFLDAATRALHDRTLEGVFADVPIRLSKQDDIVVRGAVVTVLAAQLGVS
ncbi:ROK family transcriptional regulator [Microbacterium arabinogalactanolyticum]|uniref:ROK family transcriptional regulator n=1 Tax=Microbacterium arabinogalactanolyticum TaxID=69365 RepID=UPI002552E7E7|nr:ROK family transcriptional regulator [Microbacterium arabinogalactanolyticum]GLC85238.1 ROK family protein [Microbacterium arabinogalactanolyticum]